LWAEALSETYTAGRERHQATRAAISSELIRSEQVVGSANGDI
jgi:hypothetical protein